MARFDFHNTKARCTTLARWHAVLLHVYYSCVSSTRVPVLRTLTRTVCREVQTSDSEEEERWHLSDAVLESVMVFCVAAGSVAEALEPLGLAKRKHQHHTAAHPRGRDIREVERPDSVCIGLNQVV